MGTGQEAGMEGDCELFYPSVCAVTEGQTFGKKVKPSHTQNNLYLQFPSWLSG